MTTHFDTFEALAHHIANNAKAVYQQNCHTALEMIGCAVEEAIKNDIGHYQPGIGQFPAWVSLSQATLDYKAKMGWGKGGNPDTPLWATGAFHDDVSHAIRGLTVTVGTNKDYIKYTELGTSRQPPRPVFGPATLRVVPHVLPYLGHVAALGIAGIKVRHTVGNYSELLRP
jgi:hypothetical protein